MLIKKKKKFKLKFNWKNCFKTHEFFFPSPSLFVPLPYNSTQTSNSSLLPNPPQLQDPQNPQIKLANLKTPNQTPTLIKSAFHIPRPSRENFKAPQHNRGEQEPIVS